MRLPVLMPLLLAGCFGPPLPPPPSNPTDAGVTHLGPAALTACAQFQTAAPATSIAQWVDRLNELPHPVSNACIVASVPRPLKVVATRSLESAQPADGPKNPRLFLMTQGVVLSVVPSGPGAQLLELGEWTSATRTLKGELPLPISQPLTADAPLRHVEQSNGTTTCGMCHRAETPHPTIAHGYDSLAFRPNPGSELTLEALRLEHEGCVQSGETSDRCTLYHALFDYGSIERSAFASEVALMVQ